VPNVARLDRISWRGRSSETIKVTRPEADVRNGTMRCQGRPQSGAALASKNLNLQGERRTLAPRCFRSRSKHRLNGTDRRRPSPMSDEMIIQDREELIYLLCEAAEFEHTVMCSYLYAQWTLKRAWTKV